MMRCVTGVALGLCLLVFLSAPAALMAQGGDAGLQKEIEALKKGQLEIRQQLLEIKQLVQQRPAAAPARPAGPNVAGKVFDLGDNPVKGQTLAKLTLVEFLDYQ